MFTLKIHIGIYVLAAMLFTLILVMDDERSNTFKWYAGIVSAFVVCSVIEVFLWTGYFFFFM